MSVNELTALHDRATRGETLSADEQARLDAWYAAEDQFESQTFRQKLQSDFAADWREKTAAVSARLSVVTQQTQELIAQNEILRQENNRLRQQLAQTTPTTQVA